VWCQVRFEQTSFPKAWHEDAVGRESHVNVLLHLLDLLVVWTCNLL